MKSNKIQILFTFTAAFLPQISHAAFALTEVGNGTVTGLVTGANTTVNFAGITVNRSALGFGDHTTTVEGVYYTYSFTAPSVDNGGGFSNFDAQNSMGGLWNGWGDAQNGPWQNGPTTSSWNRANRRQHLYSGANGTSTYTLVMGSPSSDATVPVSMMSQPEFGDELKVSVFLNAVDNTILSVYENLTKSESFEYLTTDGAVPGGNLTFSNINFRSDNSLESMNYTYGTLVVPEPSAVMLFTVAVVGAAMRRRRSVI